jgi:hypothetical protein
LREREVFTVFWEREKNGCENNTKTVGGVIVENNSAECLVEWLGGNSAKDKLIRSIIPQIC